MRQLDLQKSGSLVRVTLQRSGDILNLNSLVVEMVHFSSTADCVGYFSEQGVVGRGQVMQEIGANAFF